MAVNLKYLTFNVSKFLDSELFFNYERFDNHHGFILDFEWAYCDLFLNIGRNFDKENSLYINLVYNKKVYFELIVLKDSDFTQNKKDELLNTLCKIRDKELWKLQIKKEIDW